jgi:hypothetical protein
MKVILFVTIGAMMISGLLIATTVDVLSGKKSPYDSGYNHGCSDARISDYSDRYINQYEKGPAFHTNEFMRGYNSGYDSCSGSNNVSSPSESQSQAQSSNNNNENTNNNALSQSQTTQIYICNDTGCRIQ